MDKEKTKSKIMGNGMKKDELFSFIRWINLIIGIMNLYFFSIGGGYHFIGIGALNVGVWTATRRIKT